MVYKSKRRNVELNVENKQLMFLFITMYRCFFLKKKKGKRETKSTFFLISYLLST
jgi:hypothetical protein